MRWSTQMLTIEFGIRKHSINDRCYYLLITINILADYQLLNILQYRSKLHSPMYTKKQSWLQIQSLGCLGLFPITDLPLNSQFRVWFACYFLSKDKKIIIFLKVELCAVCGVCTFLSFKRKSPSKIRY